MINIWGSGSHQELCGCLAENNSYVAASAQIPESTGLIMHERVSHEPRPFKLGWKWALDHDDACNCKIDTLDFDIANY